MGEEGVCPLRPEKPCSAREVSFQGLMSHDRQKTDRQTGVRVGWEGGGGSEVGGVEAALGTSGLLRKTFSRPHRTPPPSPPIPFQHCRVLALRPSHSGLLATSSSSNTHLRIFAYAVPTTTGNSFLILPDSA